MSQKTKVLALTAMAMVLVVSLGMASVEWLAWIGFQRQAAGVPRPGNFSILPAAEAAATSGLNGVPLDISLVPALSGNGFAVYRSGRIDLTNSTDPLYINDSNYPPGAAGNPLALGHYTSASGKTVTLISLPRGYSLTINYSVVANPLLPFNLVDFETLQSANPNAEFGFDVATLAGGWLGRLDDQGQYLPAGLYDAGTGVWQINFAVSASMYDLSGLDCTLDNDPALVIQIGVVWSGVTVTPPGAVIPPPTYRLTVYGIPEN